MDPKSSSLVRAETVGDEANSSKQKRTQTRHRGHMRSWRRLRRFNATGMDHGMYISPAGPFLPRVVLIFHPIMRTFYVIICHTPFLTFRSIPGLQIQTILHQRLAFWYFDDFVDHDGYRILLLVFVENGGGLIPAACRSLRRMP